ncbi:hypothetical protein QFZ45_004141 [Pseudomonas synxantha]|nr:hypothetical protein [Pseudomonas synxantha]
MKDTNSQSEQSAAIRQVTDLSFNSDQAADNGF